MPVHSVSATVRDIELTAIASNGQTMCPDASRNEAIERHCFAVQEMDAIGHHIGDAEHRSIRRKPNVLRDAPGWQLNGGDHAPLWQIDLD